MFRCEEGNHDEVCEWCEGGPDRWVFRQAYDSETKTASALPANAIKFGFDLADIRLPKFPEAKK